MLPSLSLVHLRFFSKSTPESFFQLFTNPSPSKSATDDQGRPLHPLYIPGLTEKVESIPDTTRLVKQQQTPDFSSNFQVDNLTSAPSNYKDNQFDITIVGAGIVGSSLALSLATNPSTCNNKIALINPVHPPTLQSSEIDSFVPTGRFSSFRPSSIYFFEQLGIWNQLSQTKAHAFDRIAIWDSSLSNQIQFSVDDFELTSGVEDQKPAMGFIIPDRYVHQALWYSLKKQPNIKIFQDINASQFEFPEKGSFDWVNVHLSNKNQISSRLVVGADGRNSVVRKACGFETFGYDYNSMAITAVVKLDKPQTTAFQKFYSKSILAVLPWIDSHAFITWSTTPEDALEIASLDDDAFVNRLNFELEISHTLDGTSFGTTFAGTPLGDSPFLNSKPTASFFSKPDSIQNTPVVTQVLSPRPAFGLKLMHSVDYINSRAALVGDACHVIHPLAGQGVNLGISDVITLQKYLSIASESGADWGDFHLLEQYQAERLKQNVPMLASCDLLKRVFSSDLWPIELARTTGMNALNALPMAKRELMKMASGF